VPVNPDCRYYVMQTTARGDKVERCKMDANEPLPFACPPSCLFFEPRSVSSAGWQVSRRDVPPGKSGPPGSRG
jgi:hypothetical protein